VKFSLAILILALTTQPGFASPGSHKQASYHRPAVGSVTKRIPAGNHVVRVKWKSYYYYDGRFYDRRPYGYVVVRAPYGVRVAHLPAGYLTWGFGTSRYYYVAGTWYIQDKKEFEVVEAPLISANIVKSVNQNLVAYAARNQSDIQAQQDRYQCHRWAFEQTGYDPSLPGSSRTMQPDYNRAMSACLEARGYTVK
jgi:hypothetical protein